MFFTMELRENFKKQNPNAEFGPWLVSPHSCSLVDNVLTAGTGQLARIMGAKWKELSDAEKAVRFCPLALCGLRDRLRQPRSLQPYVEKHEQDKERAAADKQAYEVCRFD